MGIPQDSPAKDIGTFFDKVSSTSLPVPINDLSLSGGSVIVVLTAWDNTDTADGQTTRLSCSDSAGNTYVKAMEFTNGQGAAEAGATVAIFVTVPDFDLPFGGTVKVTSDTARVAKVARVLRFDMEPGLYAEVVIVGTATAADDGVDPSAMTISGLDSAEYLFVHAIAIEGPSSDTYTATPLYSSVLQNLGTGGAPPASNMLLWSEVRVFTGTGDTVDITSDVADRDGAQAFVALLELSHGYVCQY